MLHSGEDQRAQRAPPARVRFCGDPRLIRLIRPTLDGIESAERCRYRLGTSSIRGNPLARSRDHKTKTELMRTKR
jgi:hypothetical protein